jgi:hypothetical protein
MDDGIVALSWALRDDFNWRSIAFAKVQRNDCIQGVMHQISEALLARSAEIVAPDLARLYRPQNVVHINNEATFRSEFQGVILGTELAAHTSVADLGEIGSDSTVLDIVVVIKGV